MKTAATNISRNMENEITYLSCAVFTSNALDISIRKRTSSAFLLLMSSALLVKTAQDK